MKTSMFAIALGLALVTVAETAEAAPGRFSVNIGFGNYGYGTYRHDTCRSYPRTHRVWVPGRYEWRERAVTIPGRYVWVRQPVYTGRGYSSCEPRRIERRRVWQPARREIVRERVWIPGRWTIRRY